MLTDFVAQKVMGEIGALTRDIEEQQARLEQVAKAVSNAAREVNAGKNASHSQTEAVLKSQFGLLTDVIRSLKSSEEILRQSGPQDARVLLSPLIEEMGTSVRALSDKGQWAAQLLNSVRDVEKDIAGKLMYAAIIGILLFAGGGAVGYILGHGAR